MKYLLMGCTVAAMVALTARTEARPAGLISLERYQAPKIAPRVAPMFGLASWYGEECQGNTTATGEAYDMNEFTAAHRSLPLGTRIKITNLKNKRSVVVRINDRGPFCRNRLLDVSMAAAKKLGFTAAGVARVRAEVVSSPRNIPAISPRH